ncbi:hypothetical protein HDE_07339 [Halotydeus destructor]|nr:hypothetical protein HDE_07339 [Halotydeus destructor]
MRFTLLCILLSAILFVNDAQRPARRQRKRVCSLTREVGTACARKILVWGDRDQYVPHTADEGKIFCDGMYEAADCLDSYGNCMSRFQHSLIRTITRHIRYELRSSLCTYDGRVEMAEKIKCIDKEQIRAQGQHRCMDVYVVMSKVIRDQLSPSEHFAGGCCSYYIFRKCILDFADEVCKEFHEGTKVYWDHMLSRSFNALQGFICNGKWDSLRACKKNAPDVMEKFYNATSGFIEQQFESPMLMFVDIMGERLKKGKAIVSIDAN